MTAAPEIVTLGCRLNLAESERIGAMLAGEDCTVVNTCAVTAQAVRDSRRAVRRARARRPEARLIVTGCASEIDGELFAGLADAVVPNAAKLEPAAWLALGEDRTATARPELAPGLPFPGRGAQGEELGSDRLSPDGMGQRLHPFARLVPHTRAFIPVQTGCDHACTFCVIPHGRGPSRSRTTGEVVAEIVALADAGVAEVVLTGVDLTAWGLDLPGAPRLGALVEAILRDCPSLPRLRLSSLDGVEIDARLFELIVGEARVMPHVHLSLQAGDDLVLKRMRRRHRQADAVALAERLRARRPEITLGADLIAGFPTESEAMHANSLAAIDDCDIVHGHVFPYSPRPATPAARMPQVPPERVRERAAALRARVDERRRRWLAGLIGSAHEVLAERDGTGHAANFARFRLPLGTAPGALVRLRADAVEDGLLVGTAA